MKKYKTEHYETLKRDLFPRMIPHPIFSGETNREIRAVGNSEPQLGYNPEPLLEPAPEPHQPTLEEIWEWLGNADEYRMPQMSDNYKKN